MIKRIIFDVDDTLFPSSLQYKHAIAKTLEELEMYDNKLIDIINDSYGEYEKQFDHYEKELFINFFNNNYSLNMTEEIYNKLNDSFINNGANALEDNLVETLEYLSKKYELVILTNFISEVQIKRIEKSGIAKYFKEFFCGNQVLKPNKKSYLLACGNHLPKECLFIGDSIKNDYEAPKKNGLQAILYDKLGRYSHVKDRINNLIELKEIL